jgi:hypothetical protein
MIYSSMSQSLNVVRALERSQRDISPCAWLASVFAAADGQGGPGVAATIAPCGAPADSAAFDA